jgi:succinate dehydrogenase / fumarate reductase, cytochrome b subunit
MSSAAIGSPSAASVRFYQTTVFKKAVMAVTGFVLFGFVIGHMIGNLQIFAGREKLDAYGHFLHSLPELLWPVRIVLLTCVTLHIVTTIQLALLKREARPVPYFRKDNSHSSYASRTMYWSGPIIAAFIIYHILHLTLGVAQPSVYVEGAVYDNVVYGFQNYAISAFYILAMALLCLHLYHGAWSMFQSVGISHPRYTPLLRKFAALMAAIIFIGNVSIPVSVLLGWVK